MCQGGKDDGLGLGAKLVASGFDTYLTYSNQSTIFNHPPFDSEQQRLMDG